MFSKVAQAVFASMDVPRKFSADCLKDLNYLVLKIKHLLPVGDKT